MTDPQINKILKDKKVTHCYIMKHGAYYRPNSCGYTEMKYRAGIYTKEDAASSARSCRDLLIIPINQAEHNKMIGQEIAELSLKFI